jgi:hypothetical protein
MKLAVVASLLSTVAAFAPVQQSVTSSGTTALKAFEDELGAQVRKPRQKERMTKQEQRSKRRLFVSLLALVCECRRVVFFFSLTHTRTPRPCPSPSLFLFFS